MENLTIRPYRPEDWSRLAAVHDAARLQELWLAGLEEAFLPLEIAAERENLFDYTLRVAEWDGQIAGFAAYTEDELAWLYVDPAYMRRGIGSQLVRYVREHTAARPLIIEVLAGNEPALALYQSLGFHIVDTQTGAMPGNEAFQVTVRVLEYNG